MKGNITTLCCIGALTMPQVIDLRIQARYWFTIADDCLRVLLQMAGAAPVRCSLAAATPWIAP